MSDILKEAREFFGPRHAPAPERAPEAREALRGRLAAVVRRYDAELAQGKGYAGDSVYGLSLEEARALLVLPPERPDAEARIQAAEFNAVGHVARAALDPDLPCECPLCVVFREERPDAPGGERERIAEELHRIRVEDSTWGRRSPRYWRDLSEADREVYRRQADRFRALRLAAPPEAP